MFHPSPPKLDILKAQLKNEEILQNIIYETTPKRRQPIG
jgi:hypothetical protein